jgi:hypothetical protein
VNLRARKAPRFSQPLQAVVLVDCQMRSMMSFGATQPLGDEEVNSGRMAKLVEFGSAGFAGARRAVDDADIVGLPDFFESSINDPGDLGLKKFVAGLIALGGGIQDVLKASFEGGNIALEASC